MDPLIHKYKFNETNIVLDINSGTVHVFDDLSFDLLDLFRKEDRSRIYEKLSAEYGRPEIDETLEEIEMLISMGVLFSKSDFDGIVGNAGEDGPIKAMCLNVSHDCNLRCRYCFAAKGGYGGKRANMTVETARQAVDFLIRRSASRKNIEMDFFGGEPMLNMETVRATVDYAREKGGENGKKIKFTMTTNASLLDDENTEYLNENMYNVVLSLDGRPEVNDAMRRGVNGKGTYAVIEPKIKSFVAKRGEKSNYIRGTFTSRNVDFCNDALHLADAGFRNISLEPVVAEDGAGYELEDKDLSGIFEQYEKLANELVRRIGTENEFNFFHFNVDLENGPCAIKRMSGCGAGTEYVAVTPDGSIYPCHQFVGIEEFKLGNVADGQIDQVIRGKFRAANSIFSKDECKDCWARFFCGGGCPANSWKFNKDLKKPYKMACEMEKKRVECALWVYIIKEGIKDGTHNG